MDKIGREIASGVACNTIARILIVGVQGVTSIILARILTPSDYGIVAFSAVFVSFLSQFSDFGIGNAIIQRKDITQTVLNTAFTMRNSVSIVLVFIAFIISFIIPYFYQYPYIEWVIRLMALNFILNSIGFISASMLKREMNFLNTNVAVCISTIVGSAISIALAYRGYGFWSLVWANLLSSFVYVIAITKLKPIKLRYEFNADAARQMWRFGSYLFFSGLLIYALFNGANFLVGAVQGTVALGFFSMAFDWGSRVPTLLSQTVLTVLFPAFSKIRDDREKMISTYMSTIKYVAFISVLANITLLFIAEDFLRTVLGDGTDKWMPALNCFRILCIYGIVRAILEPIGSVITALGETKILFKATLLAALVQITFLYPALSHFGLEGVAWLILVSYSLQYCSYLPFLYKRGKISPILFCRAIAQPFLCSGSFLFVYLLFSCFDLEETFFLTVLKASTYGGLYLLTFGFRTKFQLLYDLKIVKIN